MRAGFEVVIGLEIHVEMNTRTKIFCGCSTEFGAQPNTQICPVCVGLPGSLPVLNRGAIDRLITLALALDSRIQPRAKFDRKNYHYPDLPKGYQISQYDQPLARGGLVRIQPGGQEKEVRIRRMHLEEDAGKLLHQGEVTLVDYNRAGVPLVEIVTEPDLSSPQEARAFLEELRLLILYTEISDVRMEEGSLRCDANVSLRPSGSSEMGELSEIKNMNSFRGVERAIAYEVERQTALLESGGRVVRETRHWQEDRGVTSPARSKEEAHDYRYFPDPDLVPVEVDAGWISEIQGDMPQLPAQRRQALLALDLPTYDVEVLTSQKELGDYYDRALKEGPEPKALANWVMSELQGHLNSCGLSPLESPVTPIHLARIISMVHEGQISGKMAKELFQKVADTGMPPDQLADQLEMRQISDPHEILSMVRRVMEENDQVVRDYLAGKERALGFLVGQVMKLSRGSANPSLVNRVLREELDSRKGERSP